MCKFLKVADLGGIFAYIIGLLLIVSVLFLQWLPCILRVSGVAEEVSEKLIFKKNWVIFRAFVGTTHFIIKIIYYSYK